MIIPSGLIEDEKEIVHNNIALKLLLAKTSQALPTLRSGVCTNKVIIVDLNTVSHDWQDDHTWLKTRAPKKKAYQVIRTSDGEITDIKPASCGADYTVERHRYTHANSPDFHRLVVTVQESTYHLLLSSIDLMEMSTLSETSLMEMLNLRIHSFQPRKAPLRS